MSRLPEATWPADETAIERLSHWYARAMDRNEPQILERIFTADAVIDREGTLHEGLQAIVQLPAKLKRQYLKTVHKVQTHTVVVAGDVAEGETYCTAELLEAGESGGTRLIIRSLRYEDRLVRNEGSWYFVRRKLILDWTDTRKLCGPPTTS